MRNISAWSIRNPVPPLVLFFMLTVLGIAGFISMDINQMPDVSFPAANVTITQPGAAPTEMETQITQRVEAAVASIGNVKDITSTVREGSSSTMVQFQLGTPVDRAVNDVRDAVTKIRSDLPEGILEPVVSRIDIDGGPIAYFSVSTTDMTLEQLSWFVDNSVIKRLLQIEGVAAVMRGGGVDREIRIILDPARLQGYGITAAQVNMQLRQLNANQAGGRAEVAGAEQSMRVLGNAASAYQLGQTQIGLPDGRTVKLADLGEVKDLFAEQRSIAKMSGREVLSIGISKAKGSSDVTVYREVRKMLDDLHKENPKVSFQELFTSVIYIEDQYRSAIHAMIEGAVLAVLVVFLFLRDYRATIISALAIPLSAIPTFWFMDLMGFTLNTISLLALSLVAGILVDDAIVEIENIVRHMRMGKSAYQAAIDAADEIGMAVVATTMAIVAVFLPVSFMRGISGQFFIQFGLTVAVAVLMSLAVARLITPLAAAYFLKAGGVREHGEGPLMDRYMAILRWTLTNRWKMIGLGVLSFVLTIVLFATLPQTFQPTVDVDYSAVKIELPPGARLEDTARVADRAAKVLRQQPDVVSVFEDVGNDGADARMAMLYLRLKQPKERERTSVEFERAMAPRLQEIPDARISFQSQSNGTGRDITTMLVSDNPEKLEQASRDVLNGMRGIELLRDPRIEGDLKRPEIIIKPRFDVAADLGVTTAALSQTIRIATIGDIEQNLAKFSLSDRQIPIRVSIAEDERKNLSVIENLPVPTSAGGSVPLKVVADVSFGSGPSEIRRYNQVRRAVIGADLRPGAISGDAIEQIAALPAMKNLPEGVREVKFGESEFFAELITNFILAVGAGIMLVFAVLVLLYRRILPPFVNMASLLLAPLGGVLALHLTGIPVSLPVYIGLLMLFGIVAKNSILLVDFAIEEMRHGKDRMHAMLEAGHKRAQPIVMTTVAMVAGMLPIALGLAGDSSWRAPMGIAVIGGLILSTVLTLVIVPAGFTLADDLEKWLGPHLKRLFTNDEPHREGTGPAPAE
jgi:multidrug efflux pump subunit AcrB